MSVAVEDRAQKDRLVELEAVIEHGLQTFVEVGQALQEIRDSRLYHAEYATFEDYCRDRWKISKTQANRNIVASEIMGRLTPTGVIPTTERQVRPLTSLPPKQQPEAWREAVKDAGGGRPTTKQVQAAVHKRKPVPSAPVTMTIVPDLPDIPDLAQVDVEIDADADAGEHLRELLLVASAEDPKEPEDPNSATGTSNLSALRDVDDLYDLTDDFSALHNLPDMEFCSRDADHVETLRRSKWGLRLTWDWNAAAMNNYIEN